MPPCPQAPSGVSVREKNGWSGGGEDPSRIKYSPDTTDASKWYTFLGPYLHPEKPVKI